MCVCAYMYFPYIVFVCVCVCLCVCMCMCVCMCVGSHNPYTGDFGPFLSIHDGTIDFIQYRWGGGICYGGWGRREERIIALLFIGFLFCLISGLLLSAANERECDIILCSVCAYLDGLKD